MGLEPPELEPTGPMMTGEDMFHLREAEYTQSRLPGSHEAWLDDTNSVDGPAQPVVYGFTSPTLTIFAVARNFL
jgi:hypothetical protein